MNGFVYFTLNISIRCAMNHSVITNGTCMCVQDIKTMSLLCPDHTDEAVAIGECRFCMFYYYYYYYYYKNSD